MYQEWFKEFEKIIKAYKKMEKDKEIQEKKSAKEFYKIKENFKEAGFTEEQSFNLLQTIINLSCGGQK